MEHLPEYRPLLYSYQREHEDSVWVTELSIDLEYYSIPGRLNTPRM